MGEVIQAPITPQIAVFKETEKYALYGDSSAGKTDQIGNLIEAFGADNVGIVSCEDGLGTIETLTTSKNVFTADTVDLFREAYTWAKQYEGTDKWVCVDGGSRVIQQISNDQATGCDAMYEMVLGGVKPFNLPVNLRKYAAWYITKGGDIDRFAVNQRVAIIVEQMFDAWKRLPCNMYWSFWEELSPSSSDYLKRELPWKPDSSGKKAMDAIQRTFDWMFRLKRVSGGPPTAYTDTASGEYRAKQRLDRRKGIDVPAAITNFNLAEFHKRIKGQ